MFHRNKSHARKLLISVAAVLTLAPHLKSTPPAASQQTPGVPATDEGVKANDAYQAKDWAKAAQ